MKPHLRVWQVLGDCNGLYVRLIAFSLVLLLGLPGPAQGQAAPSPPRVTVITDSVGGLLLIDPGANAILRRGFDLDVEREVCRKLVKPGCSGTQPPPPSALDTIQALASQSRLGKIVVIDVGYNDTPEEVEEAIDPLMTALVGAGVEKVVWVTYVERLSEWADSNRYLVAAQARWRQLILADWNSVALPHDEWFVDAAHLTVTGGRALATFLHPFLVYACGPACVPQPVFCGLVRTAAGFEYVRATGIGCADARLSLAGIARGARGHWSCAHDLDPAIEFTCSDADARIQVLRRSPVPPAWNAGVVTVAGWSFRLHRRLLQARQGARDWISLGRAPWCAPRVPRDILLALRIAPDRSDTDCFG